MKRTVQVNLGGQIFTLDEDAYEALSKYLSQIGHRYNNSPGKEEILQDIESRIAEWFYERLADSKNVVTLHDVNAVIEIMGRPEQFEDEGGAEEGGATYERDWSRRRLFKDPDDQVIGGVCSGIGHYFGVEPLWIRLAFITAMVFFGTGVFLYIILLIVLPTANTVAEKNQMRGEPIDIDGIGRSIEEELNAFGQRVSSKTGAFNKTTGQKIARGISSTFALIATVLTNIFRVIGKFIGVAFVLFGTFMLAALIAGLLGIADVVHFSGDGWGASMDLYEWGQLVFDSSDWFYLSIAAVMLVAGVPFVALAYGGFALLFPAQRIPYLGLSLFGMWFLGLILSIFSGFGIAKSFAKEERIVEQIPLHELGLTADTISINLADDPFSVPQHRAYSARHDFLIKVKNGEVMRGNVEFTVAAFGGEHPVLEISRSASGPSFQQARINADTISYLFQTDSVNLDLNAYFKFPQESKLRDQEVELTLLLPIGHTVFLSPSAIRVIDDIPNVTNTYDPRMVNHYWRMSKKGLECLDCESPKPEETTPNSDSSDSLVKT
ncbi:MAG: hypothetical protein Salg2KO_01920 [Salibacteraceae bacterium]